MCVILCCVDFSIWKNAMNWNNITLYHLIIFKIMINGRCILTDIRLIVIVIRFTAFR